MMYRIPSILLCAAACLAQTPKPAPPQPPAEVDAALRARVTEFFQYHVTGEFRKAEALVAEDSKDLFYNRNKPRYIKFNEIARIDYSENFTKAVATVMVTSIEMIPGWDAGAPNIPIPSDWKLEGGKWCWYLPPETFIRTPFGNIPIPTVEAAAKKSPGMIPPAAYGGTAPSAPGTTAPSGPPVASIFPSIPSAAVAAPPAAGQGAPVPSDIDPRALAAIEGARKLGISAAGIPGAIPAGAMDKVKPDKSAVTLTPGEPYKITFTNSAADARSLMMLGGLAGVEVKFDRIDLKSGEEAVLSLKASKDAKGGSLAIVIPQTGEMMNIKISVK